MASAEPPPASDDEDVVELDPTFAETQQQDAGEEDGNAAERKGELGDINSEEEDNGDSGEWKGTPLEQRMRSFQKDKELGMKAYKGGDVAKAVEHWSMARGSLKYVIDKELVKDDPEVLADVKEEQFKMHLNLAQGHLKTEEYRQTIEYAGRALTHDPKSEKALYRTAVAMKELSRFDVAERWIARLLEAHPGNAAAKQLQLEIERLEKASHRTAKKSASKIFEGMRNEHDPRIEKSLWEKAQDAPGDVATDVRSRWEAALDFFTGACPKRCCGRRKTE